MKKYNKETITNALNQHKKRKRNNTYAPPNYTVEVHIKSSNSQNHYNSKKRGKHYEN